MLLGVTALVEQSLSYQVFALPEVGRMVIMVPVASSKVAVSVLRSLLVMQRTRQAALSGLEVEVSIISGSIVLLSLTCIVA